jgi:hypothetical protein
MKFERKNLILIRANEKILPVYLHFDELNFPTKGEYSYIEYPSNVIDELKQIILKNIHTFEMNMSKENYSDPIRLKSSTSNFEIYTLKFERKQRANLFLIDENRFSLKQYSSFYINIWISNIYS